MSDGVYTLTYLMINQVSQKKGGLGMNICCEHKAEHRPVLDTTWVFLSPEI